MADVQDSTTARLQRQKRWRWSFISVTVIGIVLYIIGGAVIGSSFSNQNCRYVSGYFVGNTYYSGYYTGCGANSQYWAGVALVIIACLLFIPWLVLLILRFTSWYRLPLGQGQQYQSTYATQQPSQYNYQQSNPTAQPTQVATGTAPQAEKTGTNIEMAPVTGATHFCSNCEHQTTGAFCHNCGSKVQ
ncbi:hypothetical protein AMS68_005035 [Peltaster fructicola]|uniref:Uncharacterized protein n=1 Tax=Peltaster fructicola TaxID=286661 RepID=A0A6H0XY48_9PEZI|nr:hypothetical protein AMS68_005035 [Peltaster fructicola]